MNKKIIALAIATAFAAPMAAHAGATVYGKINGGVSMADTGGTESYMGVTSHDSRLGVKGSEDLGNGMKAFFKMETEIEMDQKGASGASFTRDKYLGLKSSFGELKVGHFNTAYKNTYGKMDIFADSIGDVTGSGTHGELDNRMSNMLGYKNKFGSVTLDVNMFFSEEDNTTDDDNLAVGLIWKDKGMMASIGLVTGDDGEAGPDYDEGMRLGFQMKLGAGKLNVLHESVDKVAANADYDITTVQYGINMGKNMLGASFTQTARDTANADSTQMTVGYHMNLSKATKVAFAYTTIDNDANSNTSGRIGNTSNGGFTVANGDDPSQVGVMVTHKF